MDEAQMFEKMYPNAAEKVVYGLSVLHVFYWLFGALRAARRGDYQKATFKAFMWGNFARNLDTDVKRRKEKVLSESKAFSPVPPMRQKF